MKFTFSAFNYIGNGEVIGVPLAARPRSAAAKAKVAAKSAPKPIHAAKSGVAGKPMVKKAAAVKAGAKPLSPVRLAKKTVEKRKVAPRKLTAVG